MRRPRGVNGVRRAGRAPASDCDMIGMWVGRGGVGETVVRNIFHVQKQLRISRLTGFGQLEQRSVSLSLPLGKEIDVRGILALSLR